MLNRLLMTHTCPVPAEIVEYTSPEETAVCNLASIALPRFVRERSQQVGFV